MMYENKIVRFDIYCDKCKHKELDESLEPCNECLTCPVNYHSSKPVKFEEAEISKTKGYTFKQLKKLTFDKLKKLTFGRLVGMITKRNKNKDKK